ncbi:MAG: PrsW family intramembrane metalloprotease [Anaerolineaceae bacterium]|nr:PrsW family intramembrane metalloprotease [Anaerolineaceae bacterium]
MGFLASVFFGFVPMFFFAFLIYWLDRYEKEPGILLGAAFAWDAIIAAGAAFFVNTIFGTGVYLFTDSLNLASLTTEAFVAPIVEESLKSLAVLLVFYLTHSEFDSILDGIVYAAITALGFAATENTYYIFSYGYLENSWPGLFVLVFVRVILVGWQHPFYTAFFGIGLAASRLSRTPQVRWIAPIMGWLAAIIIHSMHNTLSNLFPGGQGVFLTTSLDWLGWLLMLLFIFWMIYQERTMLTRFLKEEVQLGLITDSQYKTACSPYARTAAQFRALSQGRFRQTSRFYQLCAELAHKKNQLRIDTEEAGNPRYIQEIKAELKKLSSSSLS